MDFWTLAFAQKFIIIIIFLYLLVCAQRQSIVCKPEPKQIKNELPNDDQKAILLQT